MRGLNTKIMLSKFVLFVPIFVLRLHDGNGIHLRGKGASFPNEVYRLWIPAYKLYRKSYVDLDMTYEDVGSGNGKAAIKKNIDIEYAGSDSLLSEEVRSRYPDLVTFPTMAGCVVLSYNLPDLPSQLHLTREQIVGIYNGTYRYWNDTSLQESNPNTTMPYKRIIVIARSDKSGTTSMFTSALSMFSQNWKSVYGSFSDGLNSETDLPYHWGRDVISFYGLHNRGVSGLIVSFKYSIAYLSVANAYDAKLPIAKVMNKAGYYVQADTESVQSAMGFNSIVSHDQNFDFTEADSQNAYPIIGLTHFIMYRSTMSNCDSAKELVRYIHWFMTSEDQRKVCEEKGMSPLSHKLVNRITHNILKVVKCQGRNVWNMVQQDIANENQENEVLIVPIVVSISLSIFATFVLITFIIYQKVKILNTINKNDWHIPIEEILFFYDVRAGVSHRSKLSGLKSLKSCDSLEEMGISENEIIGDVLQWPGKWKGHQIGLRLLELKHFNHVTIEMKKCMMWMRENIVHSNVVRFYGLTDVDNLMYVIGECCMKGPMTNVLQDQKFNLSDNFKYCLMNDIAFGMQFLHSQGLIHGALTSSSCVIDSRWIVKISDWEFNKLSLLTFTKENLSMLKYVRKDTCGQNIKAFADFWVAPEIMKSEYLQQLTPGSDVFSYSIILQEIFTREYPYIEHAEYMTPTQVVHAIIHNNLRPEISSNTPVVVRQAMEIAWSDDTLCRPSFDQIIKMFHNTRSGGRSILDTMMESMEDYTDQLEQKIEEQKLEIAASKETVDLMVTERLPTAVVSRIENGLAIDAKVYKSLCIAVAEICDLKNFISDSTVPDFFSIVNFLNTEMRSLGQRHSTYVDIDSGSFILVSGLENDDGGARNFGYRNAVNLAHVCLDILHVINNLKQQKTRLQTYPKLKIGVDIGVASGGNIGNGLPKFKIFGSVIDNARNLARTSAPSRIHISSAFWEKIEFIKLFSCQEVDALSSKGESITTYWLSGKAAVHEGFASQISDRLSLFTETYQNGHGIESATSTTVLKRFHSSTDIIGTGNRRIAPPIKKKTPIIDDVSPIEDEGKNKNKSSTLMEKIQTRKLILKRKLEKKKIKPSNK